MAQILIVDDDLMFRELLKDTLELEGIETNVATNGQQALEMIEIHAPCVVVLDLKMPGVSGNDLIHWVREKSSHKDMKLIIVTGHADVDSVPEAQQVDAIFTKPVRLDALIKQINEFLSVDVS